MQNLIQYADLDDLLEAVHPLVRLGDGPAKYRIQALKHSKPIQGGMIKTVTHGVAVRVLEPLPNGAVLLHSVFVPTRRYKQWPHGDDANDTEAWAEAQLKVLAIRDWIETKGGRVIPGVPFMEPAEFLFAGWRSEVKETE